MQRPKIEFMAEKLAYDMLMILKAMELFNIIRVFYAPRQAG